MKPNCYTLCGCVFLLLLTGIFPARLFANDLPAAWENLLDSKFTGWIGLKHVDNTAALTLPGQATFQYPEDKKGWYSFGFDERNNGTRDWRDYYGLQADIWVPANRQTELDFTLYTPKTDLRQTYLKEVHTSINLTQGWHHVTLPWTLFDLPPSEWATLKFIQGLKITGKFTDGTPAGNIRIKNIRLTRGAQIKLNASVRGKAVGAGTNADYEVTLTNCTGSVQAVRLGFKNDGFAVMRASVEPNLFKLKPGESAQCKVSVEVPRNVIAPGGHEAQQLIAISNGNAVDSLSFITALEVPHPYILHNAEGWAQVRDKAKNYTWAKNELAKYVKDADSWQVPANYLPPDNYNPAEKHAFVFKDQDYIQMQNAAITWQLTRDKQYAQKVALMLNRFADKKIGYPSTYAATNNGGPQEGEDIQRVVIAYDAISDAGILTETEKAAIEHSLRLYMKIIEANLTVGNMGNWSTSQSTAALFCALAMGDLSATQRYIYGPCGFTDFVGKGIMDDGWWWEVSTSYNLWVATELTQAALACQPWGIDLVDLKVPASYSPLAIIAPWAVDPPYGVSFEKWGPQTHNTRSVKQLWDAIPKVADYRGIVFGMNDGHEEKVGGLPMEIAYYAYRDPAYATLIKLSGQRNLIYGVPELPAETPALYKRSAYAENIGYALLRSQTAGRQPKDQIQAVMKIGTQGGFHGHFDRVSLDNLTRYGRSFWNPETIWWGYPNFMYKFYVQSSVNHNMVVVDLKQQEAVPSKQVVFYSGTMMQVSVQQTNARWSDPPYLGMQYAPGETPQDQMKKNKQSLPLVTDRKYGEMAAFTEPILQRRLAIVTDDYVVLADFLKGTEIHNYDNLLQMRAPVSLSANGQNLVVQKHTGQLSDDPHSAAQLITDANWYQAGAPVLAKFKFEYWPGTDNAGTKEYLNEPGVINLDVHSLWPKQQQLVLAMPPEAYDNQQWVKYEVSGDGKSLTKGETGVWILGTQNVDVPVSGLSGLTLSLSTSGSKKKGLFWTNARLILQDGTEIPVKDVVNENVELPPVAGSDYYNGPIKIAGNLSPDALPAQPLNADKPGVIRISLKGKNAVRFKATLGGDYPFGPEEARRKIYGSRVTAKGARFLTVLEPYQNQSVIKKITATGPDRLNVELTDGRQQQITIENLDGDGTNIKVDITETKDGKIARRESTENQNK